MTNVSDAARRAAECLLRSTGGQAVFLRIPSPATAASVNDELGLGAPEFQDAELSPAVFRKARQQVRKDGARWELMVSAISVAGILGVSGAADASGLFAAAYGVLAGGTLMEIESASSSDVDGEPYVYRLVLKVPAAKTV